MPKHHGSLQRATGGSRRAWFDWHSWMGILVGLLLFLICWSGTLATVSHEIDWLLNPDQRVEPMGASASLAETHAAVRRVFPDFSIEAIHPGLYRSFATNVQVLTPSGQRAYVYVDPYTQEVTGSGPFLNVQRYLRDFHRRLLSGRAGFYLVCLLSIPLLASLVTGLVFYKRWWARFFELKPARNLRGWVSNLHKLLGLWSLWFVLLIAALGVMFVAPLPLAILFESGSTLVGETRPVELLPGVKVFLCIWILSTWAIALSWVWMLFKPMRDAAVLAAGQEKLGYYL